MSNTNTLQYQGLSIRDSVLLSHKKLRSEMVRNIIYYSHKLIKLNDIVAVNDDNA